MDSIKIEINYNRVKHRKTRTKIDKKDGEEKEGEEADLIDSNKGVDCGRRKGPPRLFSKYFPIANASSTFRVHRSIPAGTPLFSAYPIGTLRAGKPATVNTGMRVTNCSSSTRS